jgi:hypothetical protein
MRMVIIWSPDALARLIGAAARDDWGLAGAAEAAGDGGIQEKRFCSKVQSGVRGKHASRSLVWIRAMAVHWMHSSFNLVGPRCVAPAAAAVTGECRRLASG